MRDFINIVLTEAQAPLPTKTIDKAPAKIDIANNVVAADKTDMALKAASSDIVARSQGLDLSGIMAMDGEDRYSDEEAAGFANRGRDDAEPVNPHNLPALLNSEIVQSGDDFAPEWHQVSSLPTYMMKSIRMMGRQVFDQFTMTDIEDIQMMCTLLNPEDDVRKMMAWVKNNGQKLDQLDFDFSQFMPGYTALVQVWGTIDFQFAFVQDMGGHYIYAWPADDAQVVDHSAGGGLLN